MTIWTDGDPRGTPRVCACVGPQNGEPRCPCQMRHVKVKNGRYVIPEQDLGPVSETLANQIREIKNNAGI